MATTHVLPSDNTDTSSRGVHYALWTVQILIGVLFAFAGFTKATKPLVELAAMMPWSADVPGALVRFIGVSELLGGLGLILPSATRIKPILTPLAAAGLVVVMLLAAAFHLMRGEYPAIAFNAILGGLAAFVGWGRYLKSPIESR